jgi:hypothetical protein
MGAHEPPPPKDRLSTIQSMYTYGSHFQVASDSAHPAQHPTVLGANVEEPSQAKSDGGVAGFQSPRSQPHAVRLDACLHESGQDESWIFGNSNTQTPGWFADHDFDLSALNSEILMSTANWFPSENGSQSRNENEPVSPSSPQLMEDMFPSREERVRTHWYTFMGTSRTGQTTPEMGPKQTRVDETYRASLAAKLRTSVLIATVFPELKRQNGVVDLLGPRPRATLAVYIMRESRAPWIRLSKINILSFVLGCLMIGPGQLPHHIRYDMAW